MVVAGSCQNFDYAVADFQDGYVEGTAAQVIYHDLLLGFLIYTISQCSSSRLIDNTLYIQTGNLACVLGCLTLCVSKVSRYGNNCVSYRRTDICFCISLQLLQDHCRYFLRRILLAFNVNTVVRTHMTLDGNNGAACVGNCLVLCSLTNNTLALLVKCYNRRGGSCAFAVRDNDSFAAFHDCYTRVSCTQVNADNLAHNNCLLLKIKILFLHFEKPPSWREVARRLP